MPMRRSHIVVAALFVFQTVLWPRAAPADEPRVWRFAHYLQEEHFFTAGWMAKWAAQLESRSGGRIRIAWHHNNSLLRLNAIAPGVAAGRAEVGFGPVPDSPALDVAGLPFIADSAVHGTRIVNALMAQGALADAVKGLHVVALQTNAPSLIHTKNVAVRTPADLAGLRLRGATDDVREVIAALGATPVAGFLAPQVHGLLARGEIDGTLWPWEAMRIFSLGQQANHHTEAFFFVSTLGLFINPDALAALPPDLQAVVRDMSGPQTAVSAASAWDREEAIGRAEAVALGNTIITPTPAELALWRKQAQPLIDARLARLGADGYPAEATYRQVLELSARLRD
jgi:TRAP-type C4-dicarboxylate transport system substrate-binding protein